ncbi:hypothetical protein Tco_1062782, partial [Tanacetum coccineum]
SFGVGPVESSAHTYCQIIGATSHVLISLPFPSKVTLGRDPSNLYRFISWILKYGKGKEKVGKEQAAQVLLNLQAPKKKSPAEQYIFQRRSHVPTDTSVIRSKAQDEGQAGPDPGKLDEGQAGQNPDDVVES